MQRRKISFIIATLISSTCLLIFAFAVIGVWIFSDEATLDPEIGMSPAQINPSDSDLGFSPGFRHSKYSSPSKISHPLRGFFNDKAIIVAWCPSCISLEDEFYKRSIAFRKDVIRREKLKHSPDISSTDQDGVPVFKVKLSAMEKFMMSEKGENLCSFITDHIAGEGKQGGCIISEP